jgi:molecular chaperone DnaK (HSP70)
MAPVSLGDSLPHPKRRAGTWRLADLPDGGGGFSATGGLSSPIRPLRLRGLPRSSQAIGIDIGTQSCRYSLFRDEDNADGTSQDVLRSVIVFHGDQRTVGFVPLLPVDADDVFVIGDLKRIIGRDFADPSLEAYVRQVSYPVDHEPETDRPVIQIGEKQFTPEQLMAMLLSIIRQRVSIQLNANVVDAVISVPAFFTNAQRQATIDAGRIAGLNVMRIVNETAAVAMAFNAKHRADEPRNILVFDLGAGKLDVSLIRLEGPVCTVVKTAGNTQLGGFDIDQILVDHFIPELGPLHESQAVIRYLREECERAKIELSTAMETQIQLPLEDPELPCTRDLTRDEFERLCEKFFQQCIGIVTDLFAESVIQKTEVSLIILTGGSSNIPRLRVLLADFFGEGVEFFDVDLNGISVADGAAMQGAIMKGSPAGALEGVSIRNSTALSLGISLANGTTHIILPRGSILPTVFSVVTTTYRDGQTNVGFDIVQGERALAKDNIKLGHVTVDGIESAKRGLPKISVEMALDEDGILVVTAKDLATDLTVSARIENRGNLSRPRVEQLLTEAQKERTTDPHVRERAEISSELGFFLDRAKAAFDYEIRKRRIPFADQEKCRLAMVTARDWIANHPKHSPAAYRNQFEQVRRIVNEVITVR